MEKKFKSFADMLEKLPDDNSCREYLENVRWKGTPVCPHCSYSKSYKLNIVGLYKCASCKKRYNVGTGTMFEKTHIGYRKWFIAIYLFQAHKNGVSSYWDIKFRKEMVILILPKESLRCC